MSKIYSVRISKQWSGLSLADARRLKKLADSKLSEAYNELLQGKTPYCSIREKVDAFLEDRQAGLIARVKSCNDRTAASLRRRLLRFDRVFHSRTIDTCILKLPSKSVTVELV